MMLKGLTVEYLVRRTFKLEKGMTILVQAAAGGVGLILCQWANHHRRHCHRHGRLEGESRTGKGQRLSPHHSCTVTRISSRG